MPTPIQLPRVIERGVGVNDSREFELHLGCHWQQGASPPPLKKHGGEGGITPPTMCIHLCTLVTLQTHSNSHDYSDIVVGKRDFRREPLPLLRLPSSCTRSLIFRIVWMHIVGGGIPPSPPRIFNGGGDAHRVKRDAHPSSPYEHPSPLCASDTLCATQIPGR